MLGANRNGLGRSLMLVTALSPVIGYDKASAIAREANDEGYPLKEAALNSAYIDEQRFDEVARDPDSPRAWRHHR
jgi:fumarate hydratase, class II